MTGERDFDKLNAWVEGGQGAKVFAEAEARERQCRTCAHRVPATFGAPSLDG